MRPTDMINALTLAAPAAIARVCVAASPCRVRITTAHPGAVARTAAVAAMPSMPGIATSITTTSGRNADARATAVAPSAASPTTVRSDSSARRMRSPRRTPA